MLLAAVLLLAPGGAHGTECIYKTARLFLVDVVLVDGPDDGLAEETAWWEARMAADVSGDADQVYITAWGIEGEWTELVGTTELSPSRYGTVTGLILGLGGCGGACPPRTPARGRYVITEADEDWLLGATAEIEGQRLLVTYANAYGATYLVKFGER